MGEVKIDKDIGIIPDDGLPGTFYRDGRRWLRSEESKEIDLILHAPNLEEKWRMEQILEGTVVSQLLKEQQ